MRGSPVALAVAAAFAAVSAHADPPRPDTSSWKCTLCPFYTGSTATVRGGVLYADGANASSGRYTGLDHDGSYADVGAHGQWRTKSGLYGSFDATDLGLPSRGARVTEGKEGRYEVRLTYQGRPLRNYDTADTPYRSAGAGQLVLPSDWVAAGTTAGMTALGSSLQPVRIESDWRTVGLLGRYFASRVWTFFADAHHSEKTGTDITGASFLTEAVQLPEPFDFVTNTFEAGALWSGRQASVRLAYTGSWFDDKLDELLFQNPYPPLVPGSTAGLLALPPGNDQQQVSASGELELPVWSGTLTYLASDGRLAQTGSFVPGSTLPATPVLLPGSLGGDVRLTHYALALALSPNERLNLRGRATYDGRDDHTSPLTISYIVTDTFPGGTYVNPRYGEDLTLLDGSADYRVFRWVRAGVGGKYSHTDFSPGQVLSSLREESAWGYGTVTPIAALSLTVKAGSGRRDASALNTAALPVDENPLLRAYDYAPRDREFVTTRGTWTITSSLSWSLEGTAATDAYRLSEVGLQEGRERELSTTLAWAPVQTWSIYADSSYQHLEALQNGVETPGPIAWQEREGEYFWTAGAGGEWAIRSRWHLKVDYVHTGTRSDTEVLPVSVAEWFPEDATRLDTVKVEGTYLWTPALSLRMRYERSRYHTSDWALQNVDPATVPTLLALGLQPYRYDVDLIGLSFVYQLGE
ncbi:MAG TPA: MtrB/PioB family decaheme-associated outer membrane protein [Steroidobacteraceae bacterium]|nr:MtrB/PioB family decaheme-associated outer membrane protein [Steroidobacteraceae bacterium]